ncbi:MAG: carbohydrate ABC transporter permease [Sumerlaeia bacterium]
MTKSPQAPRWVDNWPRGSKIATAAGWYFVLTVIALAMVFPFLWMVSTSLKTFSSAFAYPPTLIPEAWNWSNYTDLFTKDYLPVLRFTLNSFKITGLAVLGMLLSCSMSAFAMARLNFPGRPVIFGATLVTLMVPYQLTIIPVFILFQWLGWKDTHYPLWLPTFFGGAFGVFFLRQFYISIPKDLYEAALVDGCNPFTILWRIYLPLSRPALATLGVFTFMASWNDLLNPLIYIDTLEKMPLTAGLSFLQGQFSSDWPKMMAAAMVSILPILVLYICAQKAFVSGIATTGLKS